MGTNVPFAANRWAHCSLHWCMQLHALRIVQLHVPFTFSWCFSFLQICDMDFLQPYPALPPPPLWLWLLSYLWVSSVYSNCKGGLCTENKLSCLISATLSSPCSRHLSGGCWWCAAVEELPTEEHQHHPLRQPRLSENHWGPGAHLAEPQPWRLLLPKSETKTYWPFE